MNELIASRLIGCAGRPHGNSGRRAIGLSRAHSFGCGCGCRDALQLLQYLRPVQARGLMMPLRRNRTLMATQRLLESRQPIEGAAQVVL
jgi:hypothetical protein